MKTCLTIRVQSLISSFVAVLWLLPLCLAAQGSPPTLSGGQYSGGTFSFTVNGPPSTTWSVYKSSNLQFWTSLGSVYLAGGTGTVSDNNAGGSYNFYLLSDGSVYSPVIGFVRIEVDSGHSKLIANQLNNGGNDISVALINGPASDPNGIYNTVLYLWQGGGYDIYSFFTDADALYYFGASSGDGWYDLNTGSIQHSALNPGAGAVVYNPQSANITLTLIGLVPAGSYTFPINPGYNLLSLVAPVSASLNDVYFPGKSDPNGGFNDVLYLPNGGGYDVDQYFTAADADYYFGQDAGDGWYDALGALQPARTQVGSDFYVLRNGTGSSWTQIYFLP